MECWSQPGDPESRNRDGTDSSMDISDDTAATDRRNDWATIGEIARRITRRIRALASPGAGGVE